MQTSIFPDGCSGTVLQINTSRGGIPKLPVPSARITRLGLEGDSFAHPRYHGGPNQAVLLIADEVLAALRAKGYRVFPGSLGENLTTVGLSPAAWRVGQTWLVGSGRIEFTKLRVPCATLKIFGENIGRELFDARVKSGDHSSPVWAWGGIYACVRSPGAVRPGDPIRLESELA